MTTDAAPAATIRDQRTMVGPALHSTVDDVEAAWQAWADEYGLAVRRRRGDYSTDLRSSPKVVQAYISGGKWIGDCPVCNGGVAAWRDNPRGACLDCGTIFRVELPPEADAAHAVELLAERPDPVTRSWLLGETLDELAAENDRYLVDEPEPDGVVAASEVARVLGQEALAKLQAEGAV